MVRSIEARIQDAMDHLSQNPGAKVVQVARQFGVPRNRLRFRLKGGKPKTELKPVNKKLAEPEEQAICNYIDRLDKINLAVRPEFVTDAANYILKHRSSNSLPTEEIPTVNAQWTTRFLKRHNYFKRTQKKINSDRQASENLERVNGYFNKLQTIIQEGGILPDDIYNMDETGFRIGMGKDQLIVTKRKRVHYFGLPENRESATAIECISAAGEFLPLFLILSGTLHMAQWYQVKELDPRTAIIPISSGYSNDEISLEWIKHFDKHTAKKVVGSKRLLILDGHGSHHTIEFIQYCDEHNIIPFGLPPNLTHLLQPLDVVVFQPLKHYHAKALDVIVRDGLVNISKLEFLSIIEGVRRQAFKRSTLLSAFKKTGIWPFNPDPILENLKDRLAEEEADRTPSPPPEAFSSQFGTPITLRQINKVANRIEEALKDPEMDIPDTLSNNISRFVKGSLISATELIQVKRDLGRTRYAEQVQKQRKAMKNTPLQSGGVLTVEQGRRMVVQRQEDAVAKARQLVQAAELKDRNARKKLFFEAAKVARKWRLTGQLAPAEVCETGVGSRLLKRF
jgi:hypothetical protein